MNKVRSTPDEMLKILELRKAGKDYATIGGLLNLTVKQISGKIVRLKQDLRQGNYSYANKIAAYADVPVTDILSMVIRKYYPATDTSRIKAVIKINDTIENKKIWYYSHRGKTFDAKKKFSHYIVNGSELFKVKNRDCVEV